MAHHYGQRKKTRNKYKKELRRRGIAPVTSIIQEFETGQKVHLVSDSSVQKGMPHRRFHGKTGKIIGRQGHAWVLEVNDGGSIKTVVARPQHLKPQKQ